MLSEQKEVRATSALKNTIYDYIPFLGILFGYLKLVASVPSSYEHNHRRENDYLIYSLSSATQVSHIKLYYRLESIDRMAW